MSTPSPYLKNIVAPQSSYFRYQWGVGRVGFDIQAQHDETKEIT
jgi:hypothetical protein